jgi:hypothetical protein
MRLTCRLESHEYPALGNVLWANDQVNRQKYENCPCQMYQVWKGRNRRYVPRALLPDTHRRHRRALSPCRFMRTIVATAAVLVLVGCETGPLNASATQQTDLDRLLAPIALYPDQLIAQMLLCAADPAKIAELDAWLPANNALKGTELQDAATVAGFEPSFVALALFPQVVMFMAERPDWTTRLGRAFASDRSAVFDSIQRLRTQAQKSGALKDTPQQSVESRTTAGGEQVIVIEPANPQIIYVPQYDPQVVYTQPTTVVVEDDDDDVEAAVAGLIGFTAGVALGAAIDNDYYYGPWGWHGGVYMYNDGWDDWYDAREDAREDWIDHREDLVEERGDRARDSGEQRTERAEGRQETRTNAQAQRTERQQTRQESRPERTTASTQASRGHSRDSAASAPARSGSGSDAFSGYSSGRSERAASARGQRSRGSSRGGGGRRR